MEKLNVVDRAAELAELGLEKKKIIATLTLEDYSPKDIATAFPAGEKKRTFREDYYDFLVEMLPSKDEATAWIKDYPGYEGSNIERNLSAFLRDVELVARVAAAVKGE